MTAPKGMDALAPIEGSLEEYAPGRWALLDEVDFAVPPATAAVYRIDVSLVHLRHPRVDRVDLIISCHFPYVGPRVRAEQALGTPRWPHVEDNGLLCIPPTSLDLCAGERAVQALRDALTLLNAPMEYRRGEFVREFGAYWARAASSGSDAISVVDLRGPSRPIAWYRKNGVATTYFADDDESLHVWLNRSGIAHVRTHVRRGSYVRLSRAPQPEAYPAMGAHVRDLCASERLPAPDLTLSGRVPVLLGVPTPTGLVPAAVVVDNFGRDGVSKRFRSLRARGANRALWHAASNRKVERKVVRRADGAWIHGRDRDRDYPVLRKLGVTLVGCGSLGSMIARLLQQAGVGRFEFVDGDDLGHENLSRHALGPESVRMNKALAMTAAFLRSFPHASGANGCSERWESLSSTDLERIARTDLVITAGLPIESEGIVGRWRRSIRDAPAHVSTWVEEFALVGHAVALFGPDVLLDQVNANTGAPIRITSWPEDIETTFTEAGCGNVFQPHGAAALQYSASLGAELALDVLLGRVDGSCYRTWKDEDVAITDRGGQTSASPSIRRGSFAARWPS